MSSPTTIMKCALLVFVVVSSIGCSTFMPAHPRSNKVSGETVAAFLEGGESDKVITRTEYVFVVSKDGFAMDIATGSSFDALASNLVVVISRGDQAAKGKTQSGAALAIPTIAEIAAKGIDVAANYVKSEIRKESKKYETQFKAKITLGDLWEAGVEETMLGEPAVELLEAISYTGNKPREKWTLDELFHGFTLDVEKRVHYYQQKYDTLTITRSVSECDSGTSEAFRLELALDQTTDKKSIVLRPKKFQRACTKCKVLSDSGRPWLYFPLFYGLSLNASETVETKVDVELTALLESGDTSRPAIQSKVTAFSFDLPTQDLKQGETNIDIEGIDAGSLPVLPITYDADGNPKGVAAGTLRFVITEKDRSNTPELLLQLETEVGKQAEDLKKRAQEELGNE